MYSFLIQIYLNNLPLFVKYIFCTVMVEREGFYFMKSFELNYEAKQNTNFLIGLFNVQSPKIVVHILCTFYRPSFRFQSDILF